MDWIIEIWNAVLYVFFNAMVVCLHIPLLLFHRLMDLSPFVGLVIGLVLLIATVLLLLCVLTYTFGFCYMLWLDARATVRRRIKLTHEDRDDIYTELYMEMISKRDSSELCNRLDSAIQDTGIDISVKMNAKYYTKDEYAPTWLSEYMRFLRYLDVKLIIVKKKHLAKVNEYIKELNRKAVIILFIAITLPAVAFYVAAGFSMPYIEMAALKTRVVAQRAYNYLLSLLL